MQLDRIDRFDSGDVENEIRPRGPEEARGQDGKPAVVVLDDPRVSQIVGHAIDERGLGGEALEALEEQELGPAVEDEPVGGGDEGFDAEEQVAVAAKHFHRRPVQEAGTPT